LPIRQIHHFVQQPVSPANNWNEPIDKAFLLNADSWEAIFVIADAVSALWLLRSTRARLSLKYLNAYFLGGGSYF
jgi:hypothetical protein